MSELEKLAIDLLGYIAETLKIDREVMLKMYEKGMQSVRMNYYPPYPKPELVTGLTAHSDGSAITILHQVDGVDGLQIKKDGVWVPVEFLPNAFVVNIGDILEVNFDTFLLYKFLFFLIDKDQNTSKFFVFVSFTP